MTCLRQICHFERHSRQKADALDESNSGVALRADACLKIKIGLRALLLCLEQFGFRGESGIEARLRRLLHRFRSIECALSYHHFLPCRAELIKPVGHIKYDFLMRSIE